MTYTYLHKRPKIANHTSDKHPCARKHCPQQEQAEKAFHPVTYVTEKNMMHGMEAEQGFLRLQPFKRGK